MSATAFKSTKRRFSRLNHQNFKFFRLVPRSPTHTGLIRGKTLEPNRISQAWAPLKTVILLLGVFFHTSSTPHYQPLSQLIRVEVVSDDINVTYCTFRLCYLRHVKDELSG